MAKKVTNNQNGLLTISNTTPLTSINTLGSFGIPLIPNSNTTLTVNSNNVVLETEYNKLLDYIRYIDSYLKLETEYDYDEFINFEPEVRKKIITSVTRKNKLDTFFKDENNNI